MSRYLVFTKHWLFWLCIITGFAIFIRSIPAWSNAAWGCDFGIYYGLTNSFIENKQLFNPYDGWGLSYQYFPVLYVITGVAHWISGIETIQLLPKLVPIFGGLTIPIFYFIVYKLFHQRKTALISAAFLAVLPFHAYQTSHASPLTLGHFFMMLSIYLFIRYRSNIRYIIPLSISTILLIMTHHFTTYFYLIIITCIIVLDNFESRKWTPQTKRSTTYILGTSVLILSYWTFIAKPVYQNFVGAGMHIEAKYVFMLFYILFFLSFVAIWLKRHYGIHLRVNEYITMGDATKFLLIVGVSTGLMSVFSAVTMPWTNFRFTPLSVFYSLPLILMFGLCTVGFRYLKFYKHGYFVRGWLLAIILSLMYAILTSNPALYPHRHFEYLMVPMSTLAALGILSIIAPMDISILFNRVKKYSTKFSILSAKPKITINFQTRQMFLIFTVAILVVINAMSVYPSHRALRISDERISFACWSVFEWMDENLEDNGVVASDHRLARIAWAIGFNTTNDRANLTWSAENWVDCLDELEGKEKEYGRISYIMIDDIMRDVVVHVGFGDVAYMTNRSYEKFLHQPFELIYRNATIDQNMEEIHWAEIYKVNWTHIEGYCKK